MKKNENVTFICSHASTCFCEDCGGKIPFKRKPDARGFFCFNVDEYIDFIVITEKGKHVSYDEYFNGIIPVIKYDEELSKKITKTGKDTLQECINQLENMTQEQFDKQWKEQKMDEKAKKYEEGKYEDENFKLLLPKTKEEIKEINKELRAQIAKIIENNTYELKHDWSTDMIYNNGIRAMYDSPAKIAAKILRKLSKHILY